MQQSIEQSQTPTMGVTINTKSATTTTEPPPKNGQRPKPQWGGGGVGLKCILLVPNLHPRFCC